MHVVKNSKRAILSRTRLQNIVIEIAKLEKTFAAETAADKWWDGLNKKEKQAYIKAHPRSKYAKKAYVPSKNNEEAVRGNRERHHTEIWSDSSDAAEGTKLRDHFSKLGFKTGKMKGPAAYGIRVWHRPNQHEAVRNHFSDFAKRNPKTMKNVGLSGPYGPDYGELPHTIHINKENADRT